jgi:hypothetical protein
VKQAKVGVGVRNVLTCTRADGFNSTGPQLCFNRADFTRADFNTEHFINAARRHATVEQLQHDLRLYLKIVQNSMIELINDDYAEFVNLSTSLVNLRTTLDKLKSDLAQASV